MRAEGAHIRTIFTKKGSPALSPNVSVREWQKSRPSQTIFNQ